MRVSHSQLPSRAMRGQIASAINIVVMTARLQGGSRKAVRISEIQGMEGDVITMQDLYTYEQQGVDPSGRAFGRIVPR